MNRKKMVSALTAIAMFIAVLSMTAHAAEDDLILISPRPTAAETEEAAAPMDMDVFLRCHYEKTAGMYAYDGIASQLFSIGVLLGDGVNFNLDQIPDRMQACVMVVRMRGEEAAALAAYESGTITCPFTDVTDEWVKPYLAWLYEKGIVLGVGEGVFGNSACTAQMYLTFMLRALGYTVAWDETSGQPDVIYADVPEFARDLHLWDTCLSCEPTFHRGVMSAVTYQTLAAEVKGGDARLLSVLVQAGAVDAACAQPILALFDRVDSAEEIERAAAAASDRGIKLAGTLDHDAYQVVASVGDAEDDRTAAYSGMTFAFGLDFTDGRQELALTGETTVQNTDAEMTVPLGLWIKEGTVYLDAFGEKRAAELASIGEPDALMSVFDDGSLLLERTERRYYAISDVYFELTDGNGTVIVYDMTDFMWQIIASQLDTEAFSDDAALSVLVSTEKYIDGNGVLAGIYSGQYAAVASDAQIGDVIRAEVLIESTVSYTAWGEDVTLTFPDTSQFTALTEAPSVN